jgi:hypothetical protein
MSTNTLRKNLNLADSQGKGGRGGYNQPTTEHTASLQKDQKQDEVSYAALPLATGQTGLTRLCMVAGLHDIWLRSDKVRQEGNTVRRPGTNGEILV